LPSVVTVQDVVSIAAIRGSASARHVEIIEEDKMALSEKVECPLFSVEKVECPLFSVDPFVLPRGTWLGWRTENEGFGPRQS